MMFVSAIRAKRKLPGKPTPAGTWHGREHDPFTRTAANASNYSRREDDTPPEPQIWRSGDTDSSPLNHTAQSPAIITYLISTYSSKP